LEGGTVAPLGLQRQQRGPPAGDHQHPRGLPVDPVGQLQEALRRARRAQPLDDAARHAAAAVHRHRLGLVDDQHPVVLVEDRQAAGECGARPQGLAGPDDAWRFGRRQRWRGNPDRRNPD